MSALDAKIDELYRLPLTEFTAARNALAKSLTGDEAARVKKLEKPTVVAWTVNQVYWRARSTYDRLIKSGEKLRAAQIAALEGRAGDVRAASEAHRRAITEAVAEGERLAAQAGGKPGADALARTFESLSLATSTAQPPGRLTDALQPAGFEALIGVTPSEVRSTKFEVRSGGRGKLEAVKGPARGTGDAGGQTPEDERLAKAARRAAEKEAARAEAERAKREAAVKEAEAKVARAEMTERGARETWERAHDALLDARRTLADAKASLKSTNKSAI